MGRIGAIMMTCNEEAIIAESLRQYQERDIPVAVLDGSTDSTRDIIAGFPGVILLRQDDIYGYDHQGSCDWMLQSPLAALRGWAKPEFIVVGMGDELWHHDPVKVVEDMEIEDANYCIVHSCQFFLKKGVDEGKWDFIAGQWKGHWRGQPPNKILRWYSPGYIAERRIFRDAPYLNYLPLQRFDPFPRGAIRGKQYSRNPIIRHYPHQSPAKLLERARDRVERGYQPFYRHSYEKDEIDVFYEHFPGAGECREICDDGAVFGEIEAGMEYLL